MAIQDSVREDLQLERQEESDDPDQQRQSLRRSEVLLQADSELTPALSVVIPTLNEEEGIAECLEKVRTALASLNLYGEVIVSDSSTDRTPDIARQAGAIVVEPTEQGYGAAYRYGFRAARAPYIAMGDADTTYDFEELPKLFEPVVDGEADLVMGSRLEGEIKPGAMPNLHQYIGNPLLTQFLNTFYDAGVTDAHSGMRVFSREAYERMHLDSTGMEFASEMIMEAAAKDLTIDEKPITYHERKGEETLESFRDGWRHVRFMLINAPGYLFSLPGAAMSILGTVIMALALGGVSIGPAGLGPHSMLAGSLLVLLGYQTMSLGAFSGAAADPVRKPSDPFTSWVTERVSLEQGATIGMGLFGIGATYAAMMIGRWIGTGFEALPMLLTNIVAFTAIILGIQIVFTSFFLGLIGCDS
jgi:hypothetical protein